MQALSVGMERKKRRKKEEKKNNPKSHSQLYFSQFSVYILLKEKNIMWQKCTLCHKLTFFISSLIKSKLSWLHSEEIKFQAKKYFCCRNIDRTSIQCLQLNKLHVFFIFKLTFIFVWVLCNGLRAPTWRTSA